LTDAQRLSALKIIFNNRALAAANILLKDGKKGFEDMGRAIGKISAADVARRRLDNLAGDWLKFKNTIQTFLIQAGTPFQKFMRTLVQHLTAAVKWFGNLNPHIQTGVLAFIAITGAVLLFLGIFSLTVGIVLKGIIAFKELRAAIILVTVATRIASSAFIAFWVTLLGPIGLIIAAVLVVIGIIVLLYFKVKAVRDVINIVGRAIVTAFKTVINFMKGIPAFFVGIWNDVTGAITKAWDKVFSVISGAINAVINFVKRNWRVIISVLLGPLGIAISLISKFWDNIFGFFSKGISNIIAFVKRNWRVLILITGPIGAIIDILTAHWGVIVRIFTIGVNAVVGVVRTVFNFLVTLVTTQFNAIVTVMKVAWAVLATIARVTWNAILFVVRPIISFLTTFFRVQFAVMRAVVVTAWSAILTVSRVVWAAIQTIVRVAISAILVFVRGIEVISRIVRSAFTSAYNAVKEVITAIINFIRPLVSRIIGAIGDVVGPMFRLGSRLIKGLFNGIIDAMGAVWQWFRGMVGTILRQLGDVGSLLFQVGVDLIMGMVHGIAHAAGAVGGAVKDAVGAAIKGAKGLLGIHSPSKVFDQIGRWTVQGLANGINHDKHLAATAIQSLETLINTHGLGFTTTFGPSAAARSIGTSGTSAKQTPVVIKQGDTKHYNTTLKVDMDEVSSVSKLLDIVDSIEQTARAS
jgi:phage-related protein